MPAFVRCRSSAGPCSPRVTGIFRIACYKAHRLLKRSSACNRPILVGGICLLLFVGGGILPAQDAVLVLSPAPTLSTLAGTGAVGTSSEGVSALQAALASPSALVYDSAGNLLFCDTHNHRIRRISTAGIISTVAGNGVQGFGGDNGPAIAASLDSPMGLAIAEDGTLYIADTRNHRIRRVTTDGTIQTIAGSSTAGFSGDTRQAADALLRSPSAVAIGSLGEIYIADTGNQRIRSIALDGTIHTVAGNGREDANGDGGSALAASLDSPSSLALRASDGALLIADRLNSRVRVVTQDGLIHSIPTSTVPLRRPAGVAADGSGTVYIADTGNFRLGVVSANGSGLLLGSGEQGAPETTAAYNTTPLGMPRAIAPDATGGVAFSDHDHHALQHLALPRLAFGSVPVGSVSLAQNLLLKNGGTEALSVISFDAPSGFTPIAGGTCAAVPFSIPGNGECTVVLGFIPTTVGPHTALLAINTAGAPQRVLLTGTGVATGTLLSSTTVLRSNGGLSYAGTPVTFTVQILTGSSATPTGLVHLLDAATEIAAPALDTNGAASVTTAALAVGQHSISARYGGDTHYSSSISAALQQTVTLTPDFLLTAAASQTSVSAGGTASMALTLQPINGILNQPVVFTTTGAPTGANVVTDAPTPLVLASNAVTVTVMVKTVAPAAISTHAIFFLPMLALLTYRRNSNNRRSHQSCFSVPLAYLCGATLCCLAGCGGGYLSGSNASVNAQSASRVYPITVTATTTGVTGSPLVHTASITLVVN